MIRKLLPARRCQKRNHRISKFHNIFHTCGRWRRFVLNHYAPCKENVTEKNYLQSLRVSRPIFFIVGTRCRKSDASPVPIPWCNLLPWKNCKFGSPKCVRANVRRFMVLIIVTWRCSKKETRFHGKPWFTCTTTCRWRGNLKLSGGREREREREREIYKFWSWYATEGACHFLATNPIVILTESSAWIFWTDPVQSEYVWEFTNPGQGNKIHLGDFTQICNSAARNSKLF